MSEHWRSLQQMAVEERFKEQLKPLTENQVLYFKAIHSATVTIAIACAGTGKTFVACGVASQLLKQGKIEKLILTRPMVTCGKGMGFLPGDVIEKALPFMRPFMDVLDKFFSANEVASRLRDKSIEIVPLELMRGMSIDNAMVICDESQGAEFNQIHMLMTRIGKNTKLIITGDITGSQTDIQLPVNPLKEIVRRFTVRGPHQDIAIVRLTRKDIVRNPLIQYIDETLTGDYECQQESGSWDFVKCPNCKERVWYEANDPEAVKCWGCHKIISLYVGGDKWAPRIIGAVSNAVQGHADPF